MALVKITMTVECADQAEYAAVMAKLETHNPVDGRFSTQTLTGNDVDKTIQLVFEPTTQEA